MGGGEQSMFTVIIQFGCLGLCVWMVIQNYRKDQRNEEIRALKDKQIEESRTEKDKQFIAYVQSSELRMTELTTRAVRVISNIANVLEKRPCLLESDAKVESLEAKKE